MMSYSTNQDLPSEIRDRLPEDAQELYRAAFNSAMDWYGDESKAHDGAWRAVRSQSASLNSTISKLPEENLSTLPYPQTHVQQSTNWQLN